MVKNKKEQLQLMRERNKIMCIYYNLILSRICCSCSFFFSTIFRSILNHIIFLAFITCFLIRKSSCHLWKILFLIRKHVQNAKKIIWFKIDLKMAEKKKEQLQQMRESNFSIILSPQDLPRKI